MAYFPSKAAAAAAAKSTIAVVPVALQLLNGCNYIAEGTLSCVVDGSIAPWPRPGYQRVVCLSDTHAKHNSKDLPALPESDILIHAGDFSSTGTERETAGFVDFMVRQAMASKVAIAGNHDITMQPSFYAKNFGRFHTKKADAAAIRRLVTDAEGLTYLEDSLAVVGGLRVWGAPWQPEFCEWAFNLDRGAPLREKWALIPDAVDVLITHGPPYGHGDTLKGGGLCGCDELLEVIRHRVQPRVHIFGHIHEAYGVTARSDDCRTVFINASTCTFNYRPSNPPIVFDIAVDPAAEAPAEDGVAVAAAAAAAI